MRARRITAKHASDCGDCGKDILPGNPIYWARGQKSQHVDCTTAGHQNSGCTCCQGSGRMWNNAPCRMCDGSGSRTVQDFAKQGGHPRKD